MPSYSERDQDSLRLSDNAATVLLARAVQLDSANAAKVSIAELRQAALDAGIAPEAFEQAVAEFRAAGSAVEVKPAKDRLRRWPAVVGALLSAAVLLSVFLSRAVMSAP
jgi:hypothetical protein